MTPSEFGKEAIMRLFLGGTVGNNDWREKFTKSLVDAGVPADDIFNPVVKDWNAEAQAAEEKAKADCRYMLFFISDPKQEGINISAYSMVEATMGLYDKPYTTVVVFDKAPFTGHVLKAINQTEKVLRKRHPNALIFGSMEEATKFFIKELA
jgi:hypothetical protein